MLNKRKLINIGIGVGAIAAIVVIVVVILIVRGGGSDSARPNITLEEVINRVDTDRPREDGVQPPNFVAGQVGQELVPGDGVLTFPNSHARADGHARSETVAGAADYHRSPRIRRYRNRWWRAGAGWHGDYRMG